MSILLKHITKNIWENKFRSVVVLFIVLLSTAVSFLVFSLQDIITYNYCKPPKLLAKIINENGKNARQNNEVIQRESGKIYLSDSRFFALFFSGSDACKKGDAPRPKKQDFSSRIRRVKWLEITA